MADASWIQDRKMQVYEALRDEIAALAEDWEEIYEESVWEERTNLEQRIVRLDDPAVHEQLEEYMEARQTCRDVLEDAERYAEALSEEFDDEREMLRHGPYSRGARFRYTLDEGRTGREYEIDMAKFVGEYSDELAGMESKSDLASFLDGTRVNQLRKLEEVAVSEDVRDRRIWEALTDPEPGIASFASRFNLFYAELLSEAEELDAMIEQQLDRDLREALNDETGAGYAS
ncbi:MAG: hypothetical protein SVU32_02040 [Candidatus Nanohaloarchaea archaeon]|nr:hypothetical protein [Candidatus Nanohaloarchaea archaeon]